MSAPDDEDEQQSGPGQADLGPDAGGFTDMSAMIKAERQARKKQKGTGRAPGPATLLFGRPEFIDDEAIVVSEKQAESGSADLQDIVRDLRQDRAQRQSPPPQEPQQYKAFEKKSAADDDDWDDDGQEATDELDDAASGQSASLDFFAEAELRFKQRQLELQRRANQESAEDEQDDDFDEDEDEESTQSYAPPDSYDYSYLEEDDDFIFPPPSSGLPSEVVMQAEDALEPPLTTEYAPETVDGTPVIKIPKGAFAVPEEKVGPTPVDPADILKKMPKLLGSAGIVLTESEKSQPAQIVNEPQAKPAPPPLKPSTLSGGSAAAQSFLAPQGPSSKPRQSRSGVPIGVPSKPLAEAAAPSSPTPPRGTPAPSMKPGPELQPKPAGASLPILQSGFTATHRAMKEPYMNCLLHDQPGPRSFSDRHGRRIDAEYSQSSLPDKVKITSADGKYTNVLFRQPDGTLAAFRQDAERRLTHAAKIDLESGTIAVRDFINNSIRSHSARGVSSEYVISENGVRQTDIFPSNPFKERAIIGIVTVVTPDKLLLRKEESFSDGSKTAWVFDPVMSSAVGTQILKSCITTFSTGDRQAEEFSYDAGQGRIYYTKATYEHAQSGKVTEAKFSKNKRLFDFRMMDPAGFSLEVYPTAGTCRGKRFDTQQKVVDDVVVFGKDLLCRVHSNPSLTRFEPVALYDLSREMPLYEPQEPEQLIDRGAYRLLNPITNQKLTVYHSGRIDVQEPDGTLKWDGGAAELSLQTPGGEVLVNHADGSVVKLHRKLTVEVKDSTPGAAFDRAALSQPEQEYLTKHQGKVDLRDFAEMYRRFRSRPDRLEALLRQLDQLDFTRQLLKFERIDLLRSLFLHHIAYPSEIAQGHANTAAACAIEKDFAMENPARYVAIVREALLGQVVTAGGGRTTVNPVNLLEDDMSGRDFVSRIFQTAISRVLYSPDYEFENTVSGHGRDANRRPLVELTIDSLSDAVYRVGGGELACVELESTDDILYAFHAGQERSMILLVDAAYPPFNMSVGVRQPHFVNLIGLLEGKPIKALVANHFGFSADHSRRSSGLDSQKLLDNMRRAAGGAALALVHGGIHGRRYCVKVVADKCILKPVSRGADDAR